MALVTNVYCTICKETKYEVTKRDGKCNQCRSTEESKAKRLHLASLKGLTVEERLERIEKLFYDLNIDHRLRGVESHFIKY